MSFFFFSSDDLPYSFLKICAIIDTGNEVSQMKTWKDRFIGGCIIVMIPLLLIEMISHHIVCIIALFLISCILLIVWIVKRSEEKKEQKHLLTLIKKISPDMIDEQINAITTYHDVVTIADQAITTTETLIQDFELRHRFLANLINEVVFEFDLRKHLMCDSTNWNRIADGNRFVNGSIERNVVHPDDVEKFKDFFLGEKIPNKMEEIDIRLRYKEDEEYSWTMIKGITLAGRDGKPEKILGKRSVIDRVKKENEELRNRIQMDDLCEILTKSAMEPTFHNLTKHHHKLAFLLFDIDNFKHVNDHYGHLVGDDILRNNAKLMNALFPNQNILGRVGGDEFLVIYPYHTMDDIYHIADKMLQVFHQTRTTLDTSLSITGSIGIACYPEHGTTYQELFKKADIALYESKREGKDLFHIYQINAY